MLCLWLILLGLLLALITIPVQAQSVFDSISARALVGIDNDVLVVNFTIEGIDAKTVLIKALGPTLADSGVLGVLADPALELLSGQTLLDSNNNWMESPQIDAIQNSGLAPLNPLEAAIIATLNPGIYTAIIRGVNNTTGVGLIEVSDVAASNSGEEQNVGGLATFTCDTVSCPGADRIDSAVPGFGDLVSCTWDCATFENVPNRFVNISFFRPSSGCWELQSSSVTDGIC
jgi:hypothetical protein